MRVLVTGGLGYIGSHVVVALAERGYSIVIVDNLINSSIETLVKLKQITNRDIEFWNIDLTQDVEVEKFFHEVPLDAVIHLAAFKSIEESNQFPLKYYNNNIKGLLNVLNSCFMHKIHKFVYSSSATVYGENRIPYDELMELKPATNPYGQTKVMGEQILVDLANSYQEMDISILRYFNPIGAHVSGLIGDHPLSKPNNIMPYIVKVASGKFESLNIFGADYETKDGTCIRDYIHVMDLAEGHVEMLNNDVKGLAIFNIGTGRGTSVLELVHTFEKVNDVKIPYQIVERRKGDVPIMFADTNKIEANTKWKPKRTLEDMCQDAWRFELKLNGDARKITAENP